jgi:PAS domain S-box-containing protein
VNKGNKVADSPQKNGLRILIVDKAIKNNSVEKLLCEQGFLTRIAKNSDQALKMIKKELPDLILTDNLPAAADDFRFFHSVKKHSQTKDIPLILLSGHAEAEDIIRAFKLGAVDIIAKPVIAETLLAKINIHVTNIMLRKQLAEQESKYILKQRECEQAIHALVETSKDWIWTIDTDGVHTYSNPAVKNILGYDLDEFVGTYYEDFLHPDDIEKVQTLLKNCRMKKRGWNGLLLRWQHKHGGYRCLESNAVPIIDSHGILKGFRGVDRDVTERMQIQERLKESTERYAALFERLLYPVYINDFQGNFIDANSAALDLMGYTKKDLPSLNFKQLLTKDHVSQALQDTAEILETGSQKKVHEYRVRKKDGGFVWLETRGSLIYKEGKPYAIQGIARDITKRKLAEKQLRIQHDLALNVCGTTDFMGGITLCLEAALAISDMDCGGIYLLDKVSGALDLVCHKGLPPEFIKCVIHYKNEAANTQLVLKGKPVYQEYMLVDTPKGRAEVREKLRVIAIIPLQHEGRVIGCLNVSSHTLNRVAKYQRDALETIAGQISNAVARLSAERALQDREKKYRELFENANEGILVVQDGYVKFLNPKVVQFTGYTQEEILSQPLKNFVYEGDREKANEIYRQRMEGQSAIAVYELRIISKSNKIRWIETNTVVVEWNGRPALLCFMNDITYKKQAEEERVRIEKQLQQAQKLDALGTLAGGIAHDFNNILSAIIGFSELSREELPEDSPVIQYLQHVLQAGRRARDLVKQILAFSRRGETEKKPFRVSIIIKEALKLLRASLPSTIEIKTDIKAQNSIAFANPTQIHQILMNLCANAGYAMRDKGGTLEVAMHEVDLDEDALAHQLELSAGRYLKLTVSDTGCGMSPHIMERIFDPYFTTKKKEEGTGLGLSVVHGIVKDHGGFITVKSNPDQGSVFDVYLPLIAEQELQEAEDERVPCTSWPQHILLIDDEKELIDSNTQLLKRLGSEVRATTSSREGLELFKKDPRAFDLVITDQTMPAMTGEELAVKMLEIRADVPIILCTGFSERITIDKAKTLGIREFLYKPLTKRDLITVINNIFTQSAS